MYGISDETGWACIEPNDRRPWILKKSIIQVILAFSETIEISSGINSTIRKEEWRGELVGNLFYPIETKPKGIILHLQGSGRVSAIRGISLEDLNPYPWMLEKIQNARPSTSAFLEQTNIERSIESILYVSML